MTNFRVFHLGPALAYNLNKYGTSTLAREKTEFLLTHGLIAANQPVMCSFGEIDCRVHVLRYAAERGGDFRPVIDNITANYLEFLRYISCEHPVYVWGAIPSQKDTEKINPDFPRYGTEIQRNLATEYFNERMKAICSENGFKFFSIFRDLIDSNYRTIPEYISDGCHLSQRARDLACEELRKQGIDMTFNPDSKKEIKNTIFTRLSAVLRYYYSELK